MPLFQGRNVILATANQFSRFMSEKAIGIRLLNTLSTFIAAALMMTSTLASAQTEGIVSGIVTDEGGPEEQPETQPMERTSTAPSPTSTVNSHCHQCRGTQ